MFDCTELEETRDKVEGLWALIDGASKSFKDNILDIVIVPLTRSCENTVKKSSTANDISHTMASIICEKSELDQKLEFEPEMSLTPLVSNVVCINYVIDNT